MGSFDDGTPPTAAPGTPGRVPPLRPISASRAESARDVPTVAVGDQGAAQRALLADLSRYVIGQTLGRGGMGEVRLARDERIGRDVAIKFLLGERAPSPDAVARFLREARVQGRLDHPAIVPVHDLGVDERGLPYFAMKRLAGTTLAAILDLHATGDLEAPIRWPRRLLLQRLGEVCLAVHFAHTRGVVHRDLKPSNIMLGDFGEVYVLDWGIAKIADEESEAGLMIQSGDLARLESVSGATAAGAVLGTPGYMAPEQLRGGRIDHRIDVYALGCLLFEVLALEPALPRGQAALMAEPTTEALRPAGRRPDRDIPPELDDACAQATAPDRRDRYSSARELHDALGRYLDGDRDLARRRELAAGHAAAAEQALVRTDEAARAAAMREAGRALALDPDNQAAGALVGRLLLEPPAETPREVEEAIAIERRSAGRRHLRAGVLAYIGYLTTIPGAMWMGVRDWTPLVLLAALSLFNAGLTFLMTRRERPFGAWLYVSLLSDTLLIGTIAVLFSPLLLVPSLAVATVTAFLTQPMQRSAAAVVAASYLATFGALLLEWIGVLPPTFSFVDGALMIRPWAIAFEPGATIGVLVVSTAITLGATSAIVIRIRDAQLEGDRRNRLLAWHLSKLMPERSERRDA